MEITGPMKTLTPRQLDLCEMVARLSAEFGHPPTMQEVGAALGIGKVTALRLAQEAAARGGLTYCPGSTRTWRAVDLDIAKREKKKAARS